MRGAEAQLAVGQRRGDLVFSDQKTARAATREIHQRLQVGERMRQSSAEAAQQREALVAASQAFLDGERHVGVVLDGIAAHDVAVFGHIAQRVEIAQRHVDRRAEAAQRFIAAVGGDHVIAGQGRESGGVKLAGPRDPADVLIHGRAAPDRRPPLFGRRRALLFPRRRSRRRAFCTLRSCRGLF